MKKKLFFSFLLVAMGGLPVGAKTVKKVNVIYNDGTETLSIDRSKVKKITFTSEYVPEVLPVTVGDVTFNMIKVEAGTFQMGATDGLSKEKPVHKVTLTKDYYMGETEVTQALYKAVMGSNPSYYPTSDQLPVENVSYNDITGTDGFLAKLNAATGYEFRLPTEAEWEFAARGGNESKEYKYSGSNNIDEVAWYWDENYHNKTYEVAQKATNELGLYDMSGNVWEWCSDWYERYSSEDQTDPNGPTTGSERMLRGGGFASAPVDYRPSARLPYDPDSREDCIGFRLAMSSD